MCQPPSIRDDKRLPHSLDLLYLSKHQDIQPLDTSHVASLIIFDELSNMN